MKSAYAVGVALVLGIAGSGTAVASGAFTGRVGALAGPYSYEQRVEQPVGTVVDEFSEDDFNYGILGGLAVTLGRVYLDGGIEYSTFLDGDDLDGDGSEDDTFRSDGVLNAGVFIGDRWVVFGGYRNSTYGDGFFSEEGGYTTTGPFVGGGVSFRMGSRTALGLSLAYNALTLEVDNTPVDDLDLTGISGKIQLNILKTPHSIFLRFQRFDGEFEAPGFLYEYTEDYVNVGYQATFDFASW